MKSWTKIGLIKHKEGLYHLKNEDVEYFSNYQKAHVAKSLNYKKALAIRSHKEASVASHLWHFRLGHLSINRLAMIAENCPFMFCNEYSHCSICHLSKQCRSNFHHSESTSQNIFELIHCDLDRKSVV